MKTSRNIKPLTCLFCWSTSLCWDLARDGKSLIRSTESSSFCLLSRGWKCTISMEYCTFSLYKEHLACSLLLCLFLYSEVNQNILLLDYQSFFNFLKDIWYNVFYRWKYLILFYFSNLQHWVKRITSCISCSQKCL